MESDSRPPRAQLTACVDLGKTSCRVRVVERDSGRTAFEAQGMGAPGLADARGAALSSRAVDGVMRAMPDAVRSRLQAAVIGAAGTDASPASARELACVSTRTLSVRTVVASDAVIAHAGALRGASGTVLVVGTGAVALALASDGAFHQSDGWGPWVGDEGSGRWIGQAGIRAGLRALDHRGPETPLAAAVKDIIGAPPDVPAWISGDDNPARRLGSFAQIVFDLADAGDPVSAAIIDQAVESLAETAGAASESGARVAVVGGLVNRARFRQQLEAALTQGGLAVVDPLGDALDGALVLTASADTPYERKLFHV